MHDPELTLYGEPRWHSPYVFAAYVALREKQLPFNERFVDLNAHAQTSGEYVALSLTARVPTLEHGGFCVSESSAIVEYLEEVFPAPRYARLLPSGSQERARARQIQAWLRSDLLALRNERSTVTMFYRPATQPLSPAARGDADKLLRLAAAVIPDAGGQLFDEWSIADAELAFMLQRLLISGHDVPEKVRHFAAAQWARPSVHEYVTHSRPPVE